MQTVLPTEIKTVNQAKAFLAALYFNGESFHPEDDAYHVAWVGIMEPTDEEKTKLNELMGDIYCLPDNGKYPDLIFDPCEFLNSLDPQYTLNMLRDTIEGICMQDGDIKTDGECMDEVLKFIGSVHTMEDVNGYAAKQKAAAFNTKGKVTRKDILTARVKNVLKDVNYRINYLETSDKPYKLLIAVTPKCCIISGNWKNSSKKELPNKEQVIFDYLTAFKDGLFFAGLD
jgi:hypothetical protein